MARKFRHRRGKDDEREQLLKEARALARLSDPSVVTIYEVGVVDERVYFAMEYVRGGNLRQWLRKRRDTSWRTVVELFLRAGRGLAAAPAAGIVPRAFKPEHVFVGEDGRVRVGDFGLAVLSELSELEVTNPDFGPIDPTNARTMDQSRVAGTPAYMPPEQLIGRGVGPRSDQYSFCKSLRECLDFVADGPAHSRPRSPRRLDRIIERGLAEDMDARWPDMTSLLAALERFLARGRTAMVSTAIVLTIGAVAVASRASLQPPTVDPGARCRQGGNALHERLDEGARDRLDEAFAADPRGPATLAAVLPVLERYADGWAEAQGEACDASWRDGDQSAAALDLRLACLDRRRVHFDAVLDALEAGGETIVDAAPRAVAGLPSLEPCAQPEQLARIAPGPGVPPQVAEEVAALELDLARARADYSLDRDPLLHERSAALLERAALTEHAPIIARTSLLHGQVMDVARGENVRDLYRQAFVAAQRGLDDETAFEVALYLARERYSGSADIDGARFWADTAAAIADRLELGAERRAEIEMHRGYAALFGMDTDAAVRAFERGLELLGEGGAPRRNRAVMRVALGNALDYAGRYEESLAAQRAGLAELVEVSGPEHTSVLTARSNFATSLLGGGQLDQAREEYEQLLELIGRRPGGPGLKVVSIYLNLGELERRAGNLGEAEAHVRKVVDLVEGVEGEERHLETAYHNLSAVLERRGKYAEALEAARKAVALIRQVNGDSQPQLVARARINEGIMLWRLGRLDEARATLDDAIATFRDSVGAEHLELAPAWEARSAVELSAGNHQLAAEDAARGLAILDGQEGDDTEARARLSFRLGMARLELGELDAASKALTAARTGFTDDETMKARATCLLAEVRWAQDEDRDGAIADARAARDVLDGHRAPHDVRWFERCDTWVKSRK